MLVERWEDTMNGTFPSHVAQLDEELAGLLTNR